MLNTERLESRDGRHSMSSKDRLRRGQQQRAKAVVVDKRPRWNGDFCTARRVQFMTGGRLRKAVEISGANQAGPQPFYIADDHGEGWAKVTTGRGMWTYGHTGLWPEGEVVDDEG